MSQLPIRSGRPYRNVALSALVLLAVATVATDVQAMQRQPSWRTCLARVDAALAAKDVSAAIMAWHDGYGAALASREWEAMLAMGDASLRIGHAAGVRAGFDAKARQSYLTALFRARAQRSLDGVLRATGGFAALGDRQVVEQGLHIARQVAGPDPSAQERVREFTQRVAGPSIVADTPRLEPF